MSAGAQCTSAGHVLECNSSLASAVALDDDDSAAATDNLSLIVRFYKEAAKHCEAAIAFECRGAEHVQQQKDTMKVIQARLAVLDSQQGTPPRKRPHTTAERGAESDERTRDPDAQPTPPPDAPAKTRPRVHWDDIAGSDAVKRELVESITLSQRLPGVMHGIRRLSRKFLLTGPPGSGIARHPGVTAILLCSV